MAEKQGVSRRRIQVLRSENIIGGAIRIGFAWAIPSSAEKPSDTRIKSEKYIKKPSGECGNDKS